MHLFPYTRPCRFWNCNFIRLQSHSYILNIKSLEKWKPFVPGSNGYNNQTWVKYGSCKTNHYYSSVAIRCWCWDVGDNWPRLGRQGGNWNTSVWETQQNVTRTCQDKNVSILYCIKKQTQCYIFDIWRGLGSSMHVLGSILGGIIAVVQQCVKRPDT